MKKLLLNNFVSNAKDLFQHEHRARFWRLMLDLPLRVVFLVHFENYFEQQQVPSGWQVKEGRGDDAIRPHCEVFRQVYAAIFSSNKSQDLAKNNIF